MLDKEACVPLISAAGSQNKIKKKREGIGTIKDFFKSDGMTTDFNDRLNS